MREGRPCNCCVAAHSSYSRRPSLAALDCVTISAWRTLSSSHVCMQVSDKALAQADPKAALRAVMKSWLPLSEAVLGMAVEQLPNPISAAPERLPRLLALDALDALDSSLSASVQQVGVVMCICIVAMLQAALAAVCIAANYQRSLLPAEF